MDTKEFENKRWPTYKQEPEFRHRAALSLINSASVLDVGAGDGLLLSMIREKFNESTDLVAADISMEALKICSNKGFETLVLNSAEDIPVPDNTFDTVVLLDVLEHTYDPERILREAARVARRYVVVGVPNFSSLPARLQVFFGKVPENNYPQKGHVYWFNKPTLETAIFKTHLVPIVWKMNVQRPFVPFAGILTWMFPNLFSLSFVVKLKKSSVLPRL